MIKSFKDFTGVSALQSQKDAQKAKIAIWEDTKEKNTGKIKTNQNQVNEIDAQLQASRQEKQEAQELYANAAELRKQAEQALKERKRLQQQYNDLVTQQQNSNYLGSGSVQERQESQEQGTGTTLQDRMEKSVDIEERKKELNDQIEAKERQRKNINARAKYREDKAAKKLDNIDQQEIRNLEKQRESYSKGIEGLQEENKKLDEAIGKSTDKMKKMPTVGQQITNKFKDLGKKLKEFIISPWGGVAVAVAGAAVIVKLMVDNWNKQAKAAQKAAESAKKLKQQYNKVKESYDNLKASFENYNSAQQAIKKMTAYTQEWRDAIRQSNDAILELIDKYPQLAEKVQNVNGQLQISKDAQQEFLNLQNKSLAAAKSASMAADVNTRDANIDLQASQIMKNTSAEMMYFGFGNNFLGANAREQANDFAVAIAEALNKGLTESEILEKLGSKSYLAEQIFNNSQQLEALRKQLQQNQAVTKLQYESLVDQTLADDKRYQALSDLQQQITRTQGSEAIQKAIEDIEKEINEYTITRFTTSDDTQLRDILSRYNQATGQNATLASNAVTGGNIFTGEGALINLRVGQETLQYTKQQIASIIAATQALNQLGNSAQKTSEMIKAINEINPSNTAGSEAIKNFIAGNDFGDLTLEQLKNINPSDYHEFFEKYSEQLGDKTEEALQEALNSDILRFNRIGKTFTKVVQDSISEAVTSREGLNLNAQQALADSLDKAFQNGGLKGLNSLTEILNGITSDSDLEAFSNLVGNIDWTNEDAAYELTEAIEQQGIQVDTSSQAWQNYIRLLEESALKSASAEQAINKVREALQLLNKYSKTEKWSIISDQDYNKLIQANPKIKQLFQVAADGYMFIGQQEDLMDLLTGGQSKVEGTIQHFKDLQKAAVGVSYNAQHGFSASNIDIKNLTNENVDFLHNKTNSEALQLIAGVTQESLDDALNTIKYYQVEYEAQQKSRGGYIDETLKTTYENAQATVQKYLDGLTQMQADYQNGLLDNSVLSQLLATSAQTVVELNANFKTGQMAVQDFLIAYQRLNEKEDLQGLDLDELKEYSEYLQDIAKDNDNLSDDLESNSEAAQIVAKSIMKMNDAVEVLSSNFENWGDILRNSSQQSQEYYNALQGTRSAIADLLDISERYVSDVFITEHLNDIAEAANGSGQAIDRLRDSLAQDVFKNGFQLNYDELQYTQDQLLARLQNLQANLPDMEVGAQINLDNVQGSEEEFLNACNKLVRDAGLSVDQVNALFDAMGFEVNYETKPVKQEVRNPITHTVTEVLEDEPPKPVPIQGMPGAYYMTPQRTHTRQWSYTDGYHIDEGYVDAIAMGTNGKTPQIKGLVRKATGAFNNSSPRNAGGAGKGKSSSGKSGGSKQPTKVKLADTKVTQASDRKDLTRNPYEQVQKSYERQSDLIDNIQDKQKKLVNRDRLNNLEDQNKALEQQNKIIKERQKISDTVTDLENPKTTAEYRAWLEKYLKANFDADGKIADRVALENRAAQDYNNTLDKIDKDYNKKQDAYNKWITNVYNKASAERQEQLKEEKQLQDDKLKQAEEDAKEAKKIADDEYKKKIDNIKNYQDALKQDLDYQKTYLQNIEKIYENNIQLLKIKVQLDVDTGNLEREWLDFEKKFIKKIADDDIIGNTKHAIKELMTYANSDEIATRNETINRIRKEIAQIQAGGTSKIYGDNLAQAKQDLDTFLKDQQDALSEIQDKVDEIKQNYLNAIDDANDKMQQQVDQYERINSLVDHDVKLLELLYGDKAYDSRQKYYDLQKANNQQELDSLRKQQQFWEQRMNQQVVGSDAWKKFKQNLDNVTDDLNSKLENMIQNLSDQWQNRVDGIIYKLNNALTNGLGTDYLDEQWDYINDFDDKFLDTFNSTVGVQDVERLYNQALEGVAGNPKAQQRINNLMKEQLKILKEKDNLTKYDLERAKAMLQVEQARMDLEDARNNKTKMRLRRDSQGNYTYQYVADEEKLSDLEQALADAQANLYNTDKDHYKQNLNDLYDTYKDYLSKRKQLEQEYYSTQDEEERARIQNRIELLKQSTADMMDALTEDNEYLRQIYLKQSYFDGMGIDTSLLSMEEQMQILNQNVPQMASNIQDLTDKIVSEGGILPATADAINEIVQATRQYDETITSMLETAGTSLNIINEVADAEGNLLDRNITNTQDLIIANETLITSIQKEIEAMQQLLSNVDNFLAKEFQFDKLVETLREAYNLSQVLNDSNLTADEIPVAQNNVDTTFNSPEDAKAYYTTLAERAQEKFDSGQLLVDNDIAKILSDRLKSNQMTTEELADLIRVSEYIQSITSSMGNLFSHEITSLDSGIGEILSTTTSENGTIDQNVHIDANFPNVTDHNQIEQAFNNLVNIASMYASKRY